MARVATIVPLSPLDPNTAPRAHADGLSSHQRELEDLMSTFSRMREEACTSFHPAAHEYLLRALWTAAFGAADADAFAPSTERWKDLGFQSEEAAKDFRGAGVMGLHHLLAVVNSGRVPLAAAARAGFPLAAASINATAVLQAYFGVNLRVASPLRRSARRRCPERTLHELLLRGGLQPLQELHTELAVHLWRVWSERPRDLMGFPAVLDEACADLHEVLQEATAAAAAWAEATDAGARRAEEVGAADAAADAAAAAADAAAAAGAACTACSTPGAPLALGEALMARRRASRLGVSPQVLETLDVCASAVSTLMGQCVCSNGR